MSQFIMQTITGAIGSLGFAVLFGVRDRKVWPIMAGGAACWALYLLSIHAAGWSVFAGLFVATFLTDLLAEALARKLKTPVLLLLVPMLIPLIPGGDLYYMMDYLVRSNYVDFGMAARKVLMEAGAIAMGIVVGAYAATVGAIVLKKK